MARWASRELVAEALSGSDEALDRLIATIWPSCFRIAATVIGDASLAQDAAQDACVVVMRKVRTLRNADAFDAWVYRVVMREASRVRRRHEAAIALPYTDPCYTHDSDAIDVWRALASLSPKLRDAAILFYFDDFKTHEIAQILRVPHVTVRTRLARARERLRAVLDDSLDSHDVIKETKEHAL